MDTKGLLKEVRKEITKLRKMETLLSGGKSSGRKLSAKARKKIADGQRRRWAKAKAAKEKA
jgi:hypothetical protein